MELCAIGVYKDPGATLDDLREAVTTLEESERIARRVLGGAHPLTTWAGHLRAREPRSAPVRRTRSPLLRPNGHAFRGPPGYIQAGGRSGTRRRRRRRKL